MKKNMKKLLVSIPLNTKGFVLHYVLFILSFLLSFTLLVSSSIQSKIALEKNLIYIEQQKCIELILYSYFNYDQTITSFDLQFESCHITIVTKKENHL